MKIDEGDTGNLGGERYLLRLTQRLEYCQRTWCVGATLVTSLFLLYNTCNPLAIELLPRIRLKTWASET